MVSLAGWRRRTFISLANPNYRAYFLGTVARTLMLVRSEPIMRGRVIALYSIVFLGSTPIGGVIVGWACEEWGARSGLIVAGLTAVAAATVATTVAAARR